MLEYLPARAAGEHTFNVTDLYMAENRQSKTMHCYLYICLAISGWENTWFYRLVCSARMR